MLISSKTSACIAIMHVQPPPSNSLPRTATIKCAVLNKSYFRHCRVLCHSFCNNWETFCQQLYPGMKTRDRNHWHAHYLGRVSHWLSTTRCFRTLVHGNYATYELEFCIVTTLDPHHAMHQVFKISLRVLAPLWSQTNAKVCLFPTGRRKVTGV